MNSHQRTWYNLVGKKQQTDNAGKKLFSVTWYYLVGKKQQTDNAGEKLKAMCGFEW